MGLFHRRKINNAISSPLPSLPPGPTNIHQHSTNWPGIIIAAVLSTVAIMPVLWLFLVYLFGELGAVNPGREAAFWVVSIPFAFIIGWLVKWLLLAILDSLFRYRLEIAKEVTERKRIELLAVQSSVDPGRMTETDYQFAQVILAVMNEAYGYIEKYDAPFKGRARPWSINSALEMAKAMDLTLTQDQAGQVVKWLRANNVVTGKLDGQVNVGKYPDLGTVRALLDNKFGRPITVTKYPPLHGNWGYDHI